MLPISLERRSAALLLDWDLFRAKEVRPKSLVGADRLWPHVGGGRRQSTTIIDFTAKSNEGGKISCGVRFRGGSALKRGVGEARVAAGDASYGKTVAVGDSYCMRLLAGLALSRCLALSFVESLIGEPSSINRSVTALTNLGSLNFRAADSAIAAARLARA